MASIRRTQKLQRYFEGCDFVVTTVLFEGAPLSMEPSVYLDEAARRWAVRLPGAAPRIFAYEDVLACEVSEAHMSADEGETGGHRLRNLLVNPARVAKANAARKNYCLGMGVMVAVRVPEAEGGIARLQLPLLTSEVKRTSPLYRRMLQYGDHIKMTFDAMRNSATNHE